MPIANDHRHFRSVIGGKVRKELQKFFSTGKFLPARGKDGKIAIPIKKINLPFIVYGENDSGISRGPGEKGKVIGQDEDEGDGAGQEDGNSILVNIDMEYALMFLKDELKLPNLKPKDSETYEDIKYRYTDISTNGPESLRHNRRTWLQAMKRMAASGDLNKLHVVPGSPIPRRIISPINSDRRYRQYKEIHIPNSNAVIMFGRDGSGSMDEYRCDVVSDMCWWIDTWIRHFYEKVERCYFWHDTLAKEVDEDTFYKERQGGGTTCSTCPLLMAKQLENRFPPNKWNVYCFYFTDGDNWGNDNELFANVIREKFPPDVCNLFGVTQVICRDYSGSVKRYTDQAIGDMENYRSVSVGGETLVDFSSGWGSSQNDISIDERNIQVKRAIKHLLSAKAGTGDGI